MPKGYIDGEHFLKQGIKSGIYLKNLESLAKFERSLEVFRQLKRSSQRGIDIELHGRGISNHRTGAKGARVTSKSIGCRRGDRGFRP